jgi:hypothetical protein
LGACEGHEHRVSVQRIERRQLLETQPLRDEFVQRRARLRALCEAVELGFVHSLVEHRAVLSRVPELVVGRRLPEMEGEARCDLERRQRADRLRIFGAVLDAIQGLRGVENGSDDVRHGGRAHRGATGVTGVVGDIIGGERRTHDARSPARDERLETLAVIFAGGVRRAAPQHARNSGRAGRELLGDGARGGVHRVDLSLLDGLIDARVAAFEIAHSRGFGLGRIASPLCADLRPDFAFLVGQCQADGKAQRAFQLRA